MGRTQQGRRQDGEIVAFTLYSSMSRRENTESYLKCEKHSDPADSDDDDDKGLFSV